MYTRHVLLRIQRNAYLLALVALLGGPLAEMVCAAICAPHQQPLAQSVTVEASHHRTSGPSQHQRTVTTRESREDAGVSITNFSTSGCDTHGRSDDEQQATLTAGRSVTEKAASTASTAACVRESLSLITAGHATFRHNPRRNTSGVRVPFVLRI
jgi:hypothetical protein